MDWTPLVTGLRVPHCLPLASHKSVKAQAKNLYMALVSLLPPDSALSSPLHQPKMFIDYALRCNDTVRSTVSSLASY
jgi:hypothetical protein